MAWRDNLEDIVRPAGRDSGADLRAAARPPKTLMGGGTLCETTMPEDIDLIVAAHSYDFVGAQTLLRVTYGGIGYHSSLLPLHAGRDAVKWTVRLRDRVTGGMVYRLSSNVDGGNILIQQHVFIRPDDTAKELWRRDLAPLGVRLLAATVAQFARNGFVNGQPQAEALVTWESALHGRPRYRPDLLTIGHERQAVRAAEAKLDGWQAADAQVRYV